MGFKEGKIHISRDKSPNSDLPESAQPIVRTKGMDLEPVGIGSGDQGVRDKDLGVEESFGSSEKIEHFSDGGSESCGNQIGSSSHEKKGKRGKGLRRWKRIIRDVGKEEEDGLDGESFRGLKRGLDVKSEPTKSRGENRQKSDDFEAKNSVDSWDVRTLLSGSNDFGDQGFGSFEFRNSDNRYSNEIEFWGISSNCMDDRESGSSLRARIEPFDSQLAEELSSRVGFVVGADSDNSEDRNSKLSTATSAPKHRQQHKGHRGRESFDSNKKFREDPINFRGQNSDSNCDSKNINNAVSEQQDSTSSNTRLGVDFVNYDGEFNDKPQVSGVGPAVYSEENGQQDDHLSKNEIFDDDDNATKDDGREEDENSDSNNDQNLFHESIFLLQAAQEALEKEIEIFEEIGKTSGSFSDNSPIHSYLEESETSSSNTSLESKITFLNKKVKYLQNKLLQSSTQSNARELKLLELEDILRNVHLDNKKTEVNGPDPVFIEKRVEDMELELEGLFIQKLDVEIECFTLRRAIKSWVALVKEKFSVFEESRSLSEDYYKQLILKLSEAEDKVQMLKKIEKEVETSCQELLGTDGAMVLQNRGCKLFLYFFLQLLMLCVGFWLFFKQLFADTYEASLPT